MRNTNLVNKGQGLSLSQAQSISNLCNQRASEIKATINNINNSSRSVVIDGEIYEVEEKKPMPDNIVKLITELGELHACQAFLRENMKAKEQKMDILTYAVADTSGIEFPKMPSSIIPDELPLVSEEWGWEQLSLKEMNEYYEVEAMAAHIGQFIHEQGRLNVLRKQLPKINPTEFVDVLGMGKKSPVKVEVHHTSEQLLEVHEELAEVHRRYEQRVNYFKAKVKNLVTAENTRISKINKDEAIKANALNEAAVLEYNTLRNKANNEKKEFLLKFEEARQEELKEVAALKIRVDERFQKTIDLFLKKIDDSEKSE